MSRWMLILPFLLSTCSIVIPRSGAVEIRIENRSSVHFDQVIVEFPFETLDYGGVSAGSSSSYQSVGTAYRYAAIVVRIGTTVLRLQPIDYVGEVPLRSGRYTYLLGVDETGTQLTLSLTADVMTR